VDPPGQSALAEHRFDRPGELELERQPAPQRAPRPGRRPSATPVAHDITTPHNALTRHNTRRASEPNTRNPYRIPLEPKTLSDRGVTSPSAVPILAPPRRAQPYAVFTFSPSAPPAARSRHRRADAETAPATLHDPLQTTRSLALTSLRRDRDVGRSAILRARVVAQMVGNLGPRHADADRSRRRGGVSPKCLVYQLYAQTDQGSPGPLPGPR
jgi:hypothetical protein